MSTTWDAGFLPPSDDPLDGLARPPGDPGGIRALAEEQSALAAAFHSAGEEFTDDSRYTTREWSGDASDAFAAHTTSLVIAVSAAAESDDAAADALHQYADALAAAQAAYDEAAEEAAQARAEERAAADALNDVVLHPGSAGPPLPPVSPLRGIAKDNAAGAVDDAESAARLCEARLQALTPQQQAPPPPAGSKHGFLSSLAHGVLDVAGLVPVVGEPADGVNALWYEAQGDHLNATLSAAGMVPLLGWGATGAKAGIKGAKAAEKAEEGVDAAGDVGRAEAAATAERRVRAESGTTGPDVANDGFGAVPGSPSSVPAGADPFDPRAAAAVPAYGNQGPKTSGLLDIGGNHTAIVSGRAGPAQELPKPRAGMNGNNVSHVEAHVAATMRLQGTQRATLYINRIPCSPPNAPWTGCDALLPRMVPKGSTLTIYGPSGYVRVVHGEG